MLDSWLDDWKLLFNPSKSKYHREERYLWSCCIRLYSPHFTQCLLRWSAQSEIWDFSWILDFCAVDNVTHATKKSRWNFFYQKRSIATSTHCIFLSFYNVFIRRHLEYAIQVSFPFLSGDTQELESVQKLVKFVKGLWHVPYEAALQRLLLFSLSVEETVVTLYVCTK